MHQKQQQQAQKHSDELNKRIMGIIQLKDLDNKLVRQCFKACLSYSSAALSGEEKTCLKRCDGQKNAFVKQQVQVFREEEGSLWEIMGGIREKGMVEIK